MINELFFKAVNNVVCFNNNKKQIIYNQIIIRPYIIIYFVYFGFFFIYFVAQQTNSHCRLIHIPSSHHPIIIFSHLYLYLMMYNILYYF